MTSGFTGVGQREPTFDKITMTGAIVKPVLTGITAHAGGGQASATPLTGQVNKVSTVATAADSVLLPVAVAGHERIVINAGANSMNVYPNTGDAINALSANAAFAMAAGKTGHFYATDTGHWHCNLSA